MKKLVLLLVCGLSFSGTATSEAAIFAAKPSVMPPPPVKTNLTVEPFALRQVELLDSPFKSAMERNAKVLLALDADRLLHNTRKYAGLEPKGAIYGGWESRGIAGHTLGHYLTALSQQFAATGDKRFQERVAYIFSEMAACQKLYGDGYIGALPPAELAALRALKTGNVELKNAWVPWYTQHKVLAGLKDAWVLGGCAQAKEVTLKLADWVDDLTRNLTPEQQQQMLRVEFGGMNETLVEIYALTGDKKYLETARRFQHEAILRPLLEGRDDLAGKHANTQIPKIIGEARLYEVAGDADGRKIADYFWDEVVHHHSYVIGGNSEHEHFGPPDQLAKRLGPETAETCNTYNMLRLTRHLFEWQPKAEYFDFYERALYNHILASQDPKEGMFVYFMSLKPGHFKTFSTLDNSFWCCFGTGLENHSKYGESIYFHGDDELYVNLFIPSRLNWEQKGLVVEQKTIYPRGNSTELLFTAQKPQNLSVKVRCPQWATGGLKFELNGKALPTASTPGSFTEVRRTWKTGDRLQITIPMSVRREAMPDDANKVAFLYGPVVLAGDLGPVAPDKDVPYAADHTANERKPTATVPVLLVGSNMLEHEVTRLVATDLRFYTEAADKKEVTLLPFNEIFTDYYNVYWDVLSPAQWGERHTSLEADAARQAAINATVLDEFRPGEQQSETDHNLQGEKSGSGEWQNRKYRHAENGGWFSFDLKVSPDAPNDLVVTYWSGETGPRNFDILVDGKTIVTQTLRGDKPGAFFEKSVAIPEDWTRTKPKITVRFQAHPGNFAGGIFGVKVLKQLPAKP